MELGKIPVTANRHVLVISLGGPSNGRQLASTCFGKLCKDINRDEQGRTKTNKNVPKWMGMKIKLSKTKHQINTPVSNDIT